MKFDTTRTALPAQADALRYLLPAVNTSTPLHDVLKEDYPHFEELPAGDRQAPAGATSSTRPAHNLMDYDDLLVHLRTLLRDHERVRETLVRPLQVHHGG